LGHFDWSCKLTEGGIGAYYKPQNRTKKHPKLQNRKKIRPKPKTAYKTVKNRYNSDKWGIHCPYTASSIAGVGGTLEIDQMIALFCEVKVSGVIRDV